MGLFGERRLQGANMGATAARLAIPMLASMYLDGQLLLDELVSDRIGLGDVNGALDSMERATGARSVVVFS
jgi:S-(hydroxymethyl)glutathione dehydrogenase/alcohol dehydrogenase